MASPDQINDALKIAQFRGTAKCPAHLEALLAAVGVPARRGKAVQLSTSEAARLRERIVQQYELAPDFIQDASKRLPVRGDRIDLARLTGNEKISRARTGVEMDPGLIATRKDGKTIGMREDDVVALSPPGVILVENEAAFEHMEELSFDIPDSYAGYLVLFRGSPNKSQKICERALRRLGCPVVVFPDFDPAGLVNAMAAPGMTGILWPGPEALAAALRDHASSERKYLLQMPGARAKLMACDHPDIRAIWWIIDANGRVPAQEAFIRPGRRKTMM